MFLGRPNSKDIISDRNSNIHGSPITNSNNFVGTTNFGKSTLSGVKKRISFRKFTSSREISSLKVIESGKTENCIWKYSYYVLEKC